MFLGIGTPTEAAAAGATGAFLLAALKRALNWPMTKIITMGTVRVTVMIFMVIAGSSTFSQILAYTGVSENLSKMAVSLPLSPILILICMQFLLIFLGCFLDPLSIMMITIPIYMPIVRALGFNPVWYGLIYLLNVDVGFLTPPFGMTLFMMKGVSPAGTTMMQIYRAAVPFIFIDLVAIGAIMVFPQIATFLPEVLFAK
jgi:tripartite ATP-independent transporter DctM subunit